MSFITSPNPNQAIKFSLTGPLVVLVSLLAGFLLLTGLLGLLREPPMATATSLTAIAKSSPLATNKLQSPASPLLASAPLTPTFTAVPVGSDTDDTRSVAWGDMDGDGDLDVLTGNYSQTNKVYRNNGDGSFTNISGGDLLTDTDDTYSVAWGDMDGDGDLDILVGNRAQPNKVYRNDGDGNFTNITGGDLITDTANTRSVAWGDVDGDGNLDALIGNWGQANKVYTNDGGGIFLDITGGDLAVDADNTQSIIVGNVAGDDKLDIMVGNFGQPNKVYRNDGSGVFTDVTSGTLASATDNTTSAAWGDRDGDGDLDVLVGNTSNQTNKVYRNDGGGIFTDVTSGDLALDTDSTHSVAWGDMDGDGDLDVLVGNGIIESNNVYRNDGGGIFTNITAGDLATDLDDTKSIAWGDVDGDGDLDVLAGNRNQLNKVYYNEGGLNFTNVTSGALPTDFDDTHSVAWGDMDGDGDLDLLMGNWNDPNQIYRQDPGNIFTPVTNALGTISDNTRSIAWGDVDGDNDLDVLVGNFGSNKVYRNDSSIFTDITDGDLAIATDMTYAVAWGDMDGDGDLDVLVGNRNQPNKVYRNDSNGVFTNITGGDLALHNASTRSVAWGDVDSDGDLDALIGNWGKANKVYRNDSNGIFTDITDGDLLTNMDNTQSVVWGDINGDGDLDILTGNYSQTNKVYRNDGSGIFTDITDGDLALADDKTSSIAWGDVDGDGNLDILTGNYGETNRIYRNDGGGIFTDITGGDLVLVADDTQSIAWGDADGDGDLDILVGNMGQNRLYESPRHRLPAKAGYSLVYPSIVLPQELPAADFYAQAGVIEELEIPITYTLFNEESLPTGEVALYFSLDGGGHWLPAAATANTRLTHLATSPWPTPTIRNTHVFTWDTFASDFFGQSDNVVLRLVALPQTTSRVGTFEYYDQAASPIQYGSAAVTTFPFPVRGTQIRVLSDTQPISQAIVYRLPANHDSGALPFVNDAGQPYRTDAQGYLQGRGRMGLGDRLFALLPIYEDVSGTYTVYATNIQATVSSLSGTVLSQPGVKTIPVFADRPLILFNLEIALEWDARQEDLFLDQLALAVNRASEVLLDVSNGQMALGEVTVYQAREYWLDPDTDMRLYVNNALRPKANIGGVVVTPTDDILNVTPMTLTNAFVPGKIHMGPNWDPFGNAGGELSEDWWRALAHELGHYFLYLPDNYIGLVDGRLITTDCFGSFMTNSSNSAYSEFLTLEEWQNEPGCQETIANIITNRADWQTINQYYPFVQVPDWPTTTNSGPNLLPLAVTRLNIITPQVTANTLPVQNYDLREPNNAILSLPQANGFLIKTADTSTLTDDYIIELGHTSGSGDYLQVRGAEVGDTVCVLALNQNGQVGCKDVDGVNSNITIEALPEWQPDILISPISSTTISVTVTLPTTTSGDLFVQLYPAYEPLDPVTIMSPYTEMISVTDTLHSAILTAQYPVLAGNVRVWITGTNSTYESFTPYILGEGWGAYSDAWGAYSDAWGAYSDAWGAPVSSGNGAVKIINTTNVFSETGIASLQALYNLPNLPSWLTPVGDGYRVRTRSNFTQTVSRAIAFRYLQREVPPGFENVLNIYYLPVNGTEWLRLPTTLDTDENLALAQLETVTNTVDGIYALIATIPIAPGFEQGWNNFGYPVQATRPLTGALASIDGRYTAVANYDPSLPTPWRTFYVTPTQPFHNLVNTLHDLEFPRAYWLHATEPITLYIPPETNLIEPVSSLQFPPATFYGWVTPTAGFMPTVTMPVQAWIDGNLCGESTIFDLNGQLAYVLQVESENVTGPQNGCGADGRFVQFRVGSWLINQEHAWKNHIAWFHSLATPFIPISGLAASNDSPTPLGSPTFFSATIGSGTQVSYTWDFGDDGITGTGDTVTHVYQAAGVYTAVVTASNQVGSLITNTIVMVEEAISGLTLTSDSPTVLSEITTLTATLVTGTNVTYLWDFGDGMTATSHIPTMTHVYAEPGVYTAVVTASNQVSSQSTTTEIEVQPSGYDIFLPFITASSNAALLQSVS